MTDTLPTRFRLGDLEVDTRSRQVWRASARLDVPDLSFDLLVALAGCHPDPMDTRVMAQTIWHVDHVSEDTITQRVALLRRTIRRGAGFIPPAPRAGCLRRGRSLHPRTHRQTRGDGYRP